MTQAKEKNNKEKRPKTSKTSGSANADIEDEAGKIEALSGTIKTDNADMKAATLIREAEAADYAKLEGDLVNTVDILERAIGILEKEMAKNPAAALLQQKPAAKGSPIDYLINSLKTVLEATSFPLKDTQRLTAMLQTKDAEADKDTEAEEDAMMGAPDP